MNLFYRLIFYSYLLSVLTSSESDKDKIKKLVDRRIAALVETIGKRLENNLQDQTNQNLEELIPQSNEDKIQNRSDVENQLRGREETAPAATVSSSDPSYKSGTPSPKVLNGKESSVKLKERAGETTKEVGEDVYDPIYSTPLPLKEEEEENLYSEVYRPLNIAERKLKQQKRLGISNPEFWKQLRISPEVEGSPEEENVENPHYESFETTHPKTKDVAHPPSSEVAYDPDIYEDVVFIGSPYKTGNAKNLPSEEDEDIYETIEPPIDAPSN
ncbi:hypothetical protein NBO_613g0002 [Nosema bombycis CQ1]|uniref:Uncharacterized protein n=1 Tax=Nosema bombycis (strain CQ1 / CVCC 102059) TaxID=578461 RepID=R0MD33_NOSB1|nr:hypothetical protein NBO_613g0002 [Nosema bombycis CQ1]|eukprot:EOB11960.1 hypothetical protein NBO_613g0002 [Nosema bombycis CQ1]